MRFVSFARDGAMDIGVLDASGETVIPLSGKKGLPSCMNAFLDMGEAGVAAAREILSGGESIPLAGVTVLAPIPRPRSSILCVGRNYLEHVKETNASNPVPTHPIIFTKPPASVVPSGAVVDLHADLTRSVDYEGEVAVIIGRKTSKVAEDKAMEHVFGYTILNDVTARDLQKRHTQWVIGKGLDTFCPMGPYITHVSAMPDPADIAIRTRVNGEVRQEGNTRDLIFTIPYLIALISSGMTLEPGDIIATGTPSGVGAGFNPPRFLRKGDTVEITVDGIGVLRNTFA